MSLNDIERKLLERWESNSYGKPALKKMDINGLRGLHNFSIKFNYPVVAIAGENGTGKSTILGCVACAYHSVENYKQINRGNLPAYYRFSDFIIRSRFDPAFKGAEVTWHYSGKGYPKSHTAKKNKKWSKYDKRPGRPVQFSGISRVLPAIEQRVLISHFVGKGRNEQVAVNDNLVRLSARVLGKNYSGAQKVGSKKGYTLNVVNFGSSYSSFNMGAGEDVVFDILSILDFVPNDSLIVIEEIETGLHPKAQTELVKIILEFSLKKHLQVIFTTHSSEVLEALPPQGRILLMRRGDKVNPEYKVSGEYAFSKLSSQITPELSIYTEDIIAKEILLECLPLRIRNRVKIINVGSWSAVTSQLSAFYRDGSLGKSFAVFDGDCNEKDLLGKFRSEIEIGGDGFEEWFRDHYIKLPGGQSPEEWLMKFIKAPGFIEEFAKQTNCEIDEISDILKRPMPEDHHSFFYHLHGLLGQNEELVRHKFINVAIQFRRSDFQSIIDKVDSLLICQ